MTDIKTSQGHKWTNAGLFANYDLAKERTKKIESNEIQTKIRRRSNGQFLVKYRKDPSLSVKEEKKNGKKDKKSNKRDSNKRKLEVNEASV